MGEISGGREALTIREQAGACAMGCFPPTCQAIALSLEGLALKAHGAS